VALSVTRCVALTLAAAGCASSTPAMLPFDYQALGEPANGPALHACTAGWRRPHTARARGRLFDVLGRNVSSAHRYLVVEVGSVQDPDAYSYLLLIDDSQIRASGAAESIAEQAIRRWWLGLRETPILQSYFSKGTIDPGCWFITLSVDGALSRSAVVASSPTAPYVPSETRQVLALLESQLQSLR